MPRRGRRARALPTPPHRLQGAAHRRRGGRATPVDDREGAAARGETAAARRSLSGPGFDTALAGLLNPLGRAAKSNVLRRHAAVRTAHPARRPKVLLSAAAFAAA